MLLRQEASLDQSIDRKVRILMRLRKETANRPVSANGQDNGTGVTSMEKFSTATFRPIAPVACQRSKVQN